MTKQEFEAAIADVLKAAKEEAWRIACSNSQVEWGKQLLNSIKVIEEVDFDCDLEYVLADKDKEIAKLNRALDIANRKVDYAAGVWEMGR